VQHVRREPVRRLAVERAALVDPEAVLLVDDGDGQAVELHRLLDQRVRAHQQLQLAAGELAEEVGAAPARGRAREQRRLHELARHQRLERGEVLLGERLRRSHQRRLRAGLDRAQHRVDGDDGLAGADLAHQQPLHRPVARDVAVDGGHSRPLVARRRERQRVRQPALGQPARRLERRGPRRLAAQRAPAQERELEQQQLVEREPAATALLVAEVRGVERRGAVGQPLARAHARGKRLERLHGRPAPLAHEGEDLRRRQAVRRGVGGHVALALARDRVGGRRMELDAEPVARLELALQQQAGTGAVLAFQPRLVEEGRVHRAGLVADHRLDDRPHPALAHRATRDRPHLDDDRGRLARDQGHDRAPLLAVARQVLEQVPHRVEPQPLGRGGRLGRGDGQRGGQARRPRVARRAGGAQLVLAERAGAAEGGRHFGRVLNAACQWASERPSIDSRHS
jgi:hypothetical protein